MKGTPSDEKSKAPTVAGWGLAGIDYGSKLAGTTAIATFDGTKVTLQKTVKNQDADAFLYEQLLDFQSDVIFLDAPLSLPGVYRGLENCEDFFYRKADRMLGAMSPMFLGGLTARAMQLHAQLSAKGLQVHETYPAAQAKRMVSKDLGYKKEASFLPEFQNKLQNIFNQLLPIPCFLPQVQTWHEIDALLALLGAVHFKRSESEKYGEEPEGLIWV